jgi:[ribosomal protein S5]-alanine N-acetyltransferase
MISLLETDRLLLRPLQISDAARITELFGNYDVLRMITGVPYPYYEDHAKEFISKTQINREAETSFAFAITLKPDPALIGCIELSTQQVYQRAELGYWVGVPYWGKGYMSEAVARMLRFGFEDLKLNRIYATHFGQNPASGRVMQKAGMTYETTFRQFIVKFGEYVDLLHYGILKSEWQR